MEKAVPFKSNALDFDNARLFYIAQSSIWATGLLVVLLLLLLLVGMNHSDWLLGLLANGIIGVVILIILNYLPQIEVPINIWTFLIAAVGGILGVAILVLLNYLGYKDW